MRTERDKLTDFLSFGGPMRTERIPLTDVSGAPLSPLWRKWGLEILCPLSKTKQESNQTIMQHNSVVMYLEMHPEVASKYQIVDASEPLQSGAYYYYDILRMTEACL